MISTETIKEKVRQYVIDNTYSPTDSIRDETLLFSEGIFDSMGLLFLINFIEDTFGFKAKDSELSEENFESITAIVGFIEKKIG